MGPRPWKLAWAALCVATSALGQTAPEAPAPQAEGPQAEASRAVVPPEPLATPLESPAGFTGRAVVVLELLIDASGGVREVHVVQGEPPLSTIAENAAYGWRFQPALRDGAPVAARVRFEAIFTEIEEEEIEVESEGDESPSEPPGPELEILVGGERKESAHSLSRAEVRQLPGAFGDAFRAIEALPGVTPIVSGLPYFYIRGSPPGNIGFFLDDVRIPILFHFGAGPAVVHPAFIENVELYPGPYPARYGRFIGGVVAGHTAEPQYETRAEASLRLADAGAMVETHALDQRLSVMLGGRYSYTATLLSLIAPELDVSYWDYQARAQYRLSSKETVTFFGMGSFDNASEVRPSGEKFTIFDLLFHRLSARYRRELADGGFWEFRSQAGWDVTGGDDGKVQARMLGTGVRVERPLSRQARVRAGVDVQVDRYGWTAIEGGELFLGSPGTGRTDAVTGLQLDVPWEVQRGLRVTPGARMDLFFSGSKALPGVAPAVLAELDLSERVTLLQGFGVAQQLPSFVVPLPGIQPAAPEGLQHALQHSAGVRTDLGKGISATATVFQNVHLNLTDVLSVASTDEAIDLNLDQRMLGGARGLELLLQRSLSADLGGFLSYTLSTTRRSFGRFSGYSSFDRRHVLGGALGYQLGRGWIAGARGTFYTGIPGRYLAHFSGPEPGGGNAVALQGVNVPRTRPFWRIDWRLEKRWLIGSHGAYWAFVAEALNTTLNKEMVERTCGPSGCSTTVIGPVTIPNLGVEASL